jgi:hypothetical protein
MKINTVNQGDTKDILYSLSAAVPAAIEQAKQFNLVEAVGITEIDTLVEAGKKTGSWIRENISYKLDPFNEQNIQLPSSLLRTKKGDCKSLSLLFLSIIEAAKEINPTLNAGFRFVSYKKNKPFTHVYNYICLSKNKFHTFDCCLKDLKELQTYKEKKDMRVNYLAGTPLMIGEDINAMSKPTVEQLMRDDRYMGEPDFIGKGGFKKLADKIKKVVKNEIKFVKTVALAPARGPFLVLLDVNFRGLAKRMNKLRAKNPKVLEEFWLKVGGKIDSLNKAIDKGKDKKPFLGERKGMSGATDVVYIGGANSICRVDDDTTAIGFDPATITTALASAGAIIAAVNKLFKKEGINQDPKDGEEIDTSNVPPINPDGGDFAAKDPASPEAEKYALTGETPPVTSKSGSSFKPSLPLILGGAAIAAGAIYMLTKKKK